MKRMSKREVEQLFSGPRKGAYRGYLIQPDMLGATFYVQKDGFTIGSASTYEGAQRVIDAVHGD